MPSCRDCGDEYPVARLNLGYRTCLACGDAEARTVRWVAAPINKSNYMLIRNPAELKQLNPKRLGD